MKRKTLEMRTAIIIFISMTISLTFILGSLILFKRISDEKQANFWFDLSLSLITSIFSAGIAYVVAVIQVKSTQKIEDDEKASQNKRDINLILIEMKDNLDVLSILTSNQDDNFEIRFANNQFSTKIWEMLINKIEIPNELMADLLRVLKKRDLIFCEGDVKVEEVIRFTNEYQIAYDNLNNFHKK